MVGCAVLARMRYVGASAVDCRCPRLHVCAHHQPIPHEVRECLVGLWSAAAVPRAPPFVVCRVSDVGADCVWCGLLRRYITVTVTVRGSTRVYVTPCQ